MSHTTINYAFDRVREARINLRHKKLAGKLAKEEIAEARAELLEASQTLAKVSTAITAASDSVSETTLKHILAHTAPAGMGQATAQRIVKPRGTAGRTPRGTEGR